MTTTHSTGPHLAPATGRARHLLPALLLLPALFTFGCDEDLTLVEPQKFFEFDPANAWRECQDGGGLAAPEHDFVPPPPGLEIAVCPNPAPATADVMTFQFELTTQRLVNIGILDDRGRIVRKLAVNQPYAPNTRHSISWFIRDVPAGNYRAYFRAGDIESNGDLRIER